MGVPHITRSTDCECCVISVSYNAHCYVMSVMCAGCVVGSALLHSQEDGVSFTIITARSSLLVTWSQSNTASQTRSTYLTQGVRVGV